MRHSSPAILLLSLTLLVGCTSRTGFEDLVPRPSNEVTSSIAKPDAPAAEEKAQAAPAILSLAEEEAAVVETALLSPPIPSPALNAFKDKVVNPQRFRDAHPINFGPRTPRDHPVHGVDVSRWQGEIDWKTLRGQGANFVWIKSTDGGDHLDPMFMLNWARAAEAGVPRGAYHFFYWCRDAASQAEWFIRNVPKVKGALPPVLDVEWNHLSDCKKRPDRKTVIAKMRVFMEKVEKHYGQKPIVYATPDFYEENLKGEFTEYPFWVRAVAQHPSKVYPQRNWMFWQYSGSGLSQGVDGRIDLNVFRGNEKQWREWLARNTG
jgi:lysozyme